MTRMPGVSDLVARVCIMLGSCNILCFARGLGRLYDKGNVLLLDPDGAILTLLRNSKYDSDARNAVGDVYPMTGRQVRFH